GSADKVIGNVPPSDVFAVKPADFLGLTPKLAVKQGVEVLAGDALFYDKKNPDVIIPSPVSGEVVEIKRGAKRKILEVKVLADKEIKYRDFGSVDPKGLSTEQVVEKLVKSGLWSLIRQRPFSIIADPTARPKAIHISCFNTYPLAPDYDFIMEGKQALFQKGIDAITKLSDKVYLGLNGKTGFSKPFESITGVEVNYFKGPHPAGNVGTQINKIAPINKGDAIWYIAPQDVMTIGRLFESGKYDASKIIALTGSEVKGPQYYEVLSGVKISAVVQDKVSNDNVRYISGNPLTGTKVEDNSFLGFYDDQITVLPEGNQLKFFLTDGWFGLGLKKFSVSKTYFNWLMPNKEYALDTNLNGELRSFVMTGEMEKVFPFDIYRMSLVKAMINNDIDAMEKLGIYEVDAEDFALCEFTSSSKINIQQIVRDGMENLREELY
ncbi:MAG: NADH:ubiquinone reductase (Na(+)-transporting) subunit A, partial [Bacteroidetes bacterium]